MPQGGDGVNALMFMFSQSRKNIPDNSILLDSQSTVDIFCNPRLVENICRVKDRMKIQCNAGTRVTNLVGDLPGYGSVWFNLRAIANVLSLKLVKEKYHIQYDSDEKDGCGDKTKWGKVQVHSVIIWTSLFGHNQSGSKQVCQHNTDGEYSGGKQKELYEQ